MSTTNTVSNWFDVSDLEKNLEVITYKKYIKHLLMFNTYNV